MAVNTWFISVDDHVQEHPQVWTKRLDRSKWGDRIPHIDRTSDGNDRWVVDGHIVPLQGAANCGATMPDRTKNLQHCRGAGISLRTDGAAQNNGRRWASLLRTLSHCCGIGWTELRSHRRP